MSGRARADQAWSGWDQHQVRRWRSRYRWVTLAMVGHAFLVVAALTDAPAIQHRSGLIGLTCNEVQHMLATLLAVPPVTSPPSTAINGNHEPLTVGS